MIYQTDSTPPILSRIDTLYIDRIDPLYNETYIQLLERSNDQLSLIGNPLAWMIGALGVLFAAGAIVSGIHFWFLNKKFDTDKRKVLLEFDQLKEKYQIDLDELVAAYKTQLDATNELITTLAKEGKVHNDELMKLRGSIHRSTNAIKKASRDTPMTIEEYRNGVTKCSNCNKEYSVSFNVPKDLIKGATINLERKCPNCGTIKKIQTTK